MIFDKLDNPLEQCDLKFSNAEKGEFEGYASVFNGSDNIGDTILKGAYSESLIKGLPKMFINHRHGDIPVGDFYEAKEDDVGLYVAGRIDLQHRDGPSVYSAMKRKAMNGLSIGALKKSIVFERKSDGGRLIKSIPDLKEVSIVTFPMEENAGIMAVKSEIQTINDLKEAELFLRDSEYFSKSTATAFVSRIRELIRRDAENEFERGITKHDVTSELVQFIQTRIR